jgi:peptidoglycan/xylan/chitin deacetylase (PgdA/CDA1 family)
MKERYVLLSFDVEEFDMPLEYRFPITAEEQMRVGKAGLDAIIPLLDDTALETTLFTTANFAMHYPDAIRLLSAKHEIASHTFYHSSFAEEHLATSKIQLEEITGKPVAGLRMPRMRQVSMQEVKKAGYLYDSSINPTWLPGRYNNRHLPRTVYMDDGMLRVPASVSPRLRIPLFWLSFKNFPYDIFKKLALQTLARDGYICLYFHPWEFTSIDTYGLPAYTRKPDGIRLLDKLTRLIYELKPEAEFISINSFITRRHKQELLP